MPKESEGDSMREQPVWMDEYTPLEREAGLELSDMMDMAFGMVPPGTARVWRESGVRIGHA